MLNDAVVVYEPVITIAGAIGCYLHVYAMSKLWLHAMRYDYHATAN